MDGRDGGREQGSGGGGVDNGRGGRAVSLVVCSSIQGYSSLGNSFSSKLKQFITNSTFEGNKSTRSMHGT